MNNDQLSSALWLVCGLGISLASFHYNLGKPTNPGTGFMPFLVGLLICLLSLIGLVQATIKKKEGTGWRSPIAGLKWKKALIVMAALFGYVLVMAPLGFFFSTVLLMGFLFRAVQPQKWIVVVAGSASTAGIAYWVFKVLLQVQFPGGPWGF